MFAVTGPGGGEVRVTDCVSHWNGTRALLPAVTVTVLSVTASVTSGTTASVNTALDDDYDVWPSGTR